MQNKNGQNTGKHAGDQTERNQRFARLWRRPTRRWLLGIPIGGVLMFALGIAAVGAYDFSMTKTSSEEFCGTACHEMRSFVYDEYRASAHGSTASGVHATCPDCHLPEAFVPKIVRKIQATQHEVWHWMRGTIDTREKFENRRLYLAERVWKYMRESDSRECRSCHDATRMNLDLQDRSVARRHDRAADRGETCIDCHQGVAHVHPDEVEWPPQPPEQDLTDEGSE